MLDFRDHLWSQIKGILIPHLQTTVRPQFWDIQESCMHTYIGWYAHATPHALSPDTLSPDTLSPRALSPRNLSPDGLCENVLSSKKLLEHVRFP